MKPPPDKKTVDNLAMQICWREFARHDGLGARTAHTYWRKIAPFKKDEYWEDARKVLHWFRDASGVLAELKMLGDRP